MQAPQIRWYLFSKLKIQWGDGVCPVPQVLYRDRLGGTRFSHFRRLEFRPPKTSAEQQRENTFFRPVCLALSGGRDSSQDMNEFKFASATCASVARGPISKKSCSKSWGIGNGNRLASLSLRSQNHFARPMETHHQWKSIRRVDISARTCLYSQSPALSPTQVFHPFSSISHRLSRCRVGNGLDVLQAVR